jgi:hypothetical protein
VHEGAAQPVGGKTDGGRQSQSGRDAAPSGADGEHGLPLTTSWARAGGNWLDGPASLSQHGLRPVSNGVGPN